MVQRLLGGVRLLAGVITSRDNERLKLLRKLHERSWRDKLGLFAVEGEDLVEAGLSAGLEPVDVLVADEDVDAALLAEVSTLAHPPRVVAVFRRDDLPRGSRPVTLALWRVADPGNVGTLLRAADAFGAGVALSEGCADPTGPKACVRRWAPSSVCRSSVSTSPAGSASRSSRTAARRCRSSRSTATSCFVLGAERDGLPPDVLAPLRRARLDPAARRRRLAQRRRRRRDRALRAGPPRALLRRSRTKTSATPFESPGTRFAAHDANIR